MLQCLLLLLAAVSPAVAGEAKPSPQEQNHASWWELETAMGEHGTLILSNKPWWGRALALKPGERFTVRSQFPGGGLMLVRRQRLVRRGETHDAVVWVIDDDGDMRPDADDGDKKSDCYVVDYDADGRADRMVDYLDTDGDGRADEMEIRYFQDGRLRRAWFAVDLDRDGRMMDLAAYEYSGDFFASDPYGNNMIYCNEYDPERNEWLPSCECPFAFYDADGDGESEMVIRVSAVPLDFDPRAKSDIDYGNSIFWSTAPFAERQRHPGVVNIRYSVDIDGLSSHERPLHYDMGFNMTGRLPYQFPGMERTGPLRRSPKTTKVIPYDKLPQVADTYPAEQTGFSFREYGDDAVVLGAGPHADEDRRWEGVFWVWNRRFMHNSGGPIQLWNMRREFCPTASTKRELYYSRVDRRIHLKGATDGWTCVGHLGNRDPWGELRMFDTNGDGYFDRWETHLHGQTAPARTSTVADAGIRPLPSQWPKLQEVYTREILPEAIQSTKKLLAAMEKADTFRVPEHLTDALAAASCDSERLYVLDVIRESRYLAMCEKFRRRSAELMASVPNEDLRARPKELTASIRAWDYARAVSHLDAAYGEGRYDDALRLLEEIIRLGGERLAPGTNR